MRALTWQGRRDVRVEKVPDPTIEEPTDAIVRITSTAICGSDLHLYEVLGAVPHTRRHPRPRADGHRRGGRLRGHPHRARRPGRRPVQHLLRLVLDVLPRAVRPVRDDAGPRAGQGRRAVRLHLAVRRGAGRPGRVPAGAAGPLRADQGARTGTPDERYLYLSDILPTAWQAVATPTCPTAARSRSSGWARSGSSRPGSAGTWAPSGSSGSTWCPSGCAMAGAARRSRSLDLSEVDDVAEALLELHRRPRPGRRDRRGRHGGARLGRAAGKVAQAAVGLLPDARGAAADRHASRSTGSTRCTPRSRPSAAAAPCRSAGSTAARSTRCR